jgi:hypothetical protein
MHVLTLSRQKQRIYCFTKGLAKLYVVPFETVANMHYIVIVSLHQSDLLLLCNPDPIISRPLYYVAHITAIGVLRSNLTGWLLS